MADIEVLLDVLANLKHDNYEKSYRGSKDMEADIDLIHAALQERDSLQAQLDEAIKQAQCMVARNDALIANERRLIAQLDAMRAIGGSMSNVCFNVAQREGVPKDTVSMLKDLAHKWDKAARLRQQAKKPSK